MLEKTPSRRGKSAAEASPGRVARNRMRIAWMYYVEGLTQNEIADRLELPLMVADNQDPLGTEYTVS